MPCFVVLAFFAIAIGIVYELWYFLIAVLCLASCFTAWGAFDIRLGYFTPTYVKQKNSTEKLLALTFDDGPTPFTADIMALLDQYDSKATFFCIGKQMERYPELTRQLLANGHQIGNHTYSHSTNFGFLSTDEVVAEIEKCNAVLAKCTQTQTSLFRPPFGVTNPSVARAVKQLKPLVIGWSNRSLDTVITDEDRIFRRVVRKLQAGDIILFHDTSARTVNVLRKFLPYLKAEGYRCVSVDDLLNLHNHEK
ncbi:polysaccharide deacetylase family protein [Sphingobacterium oryzagri]|uniref:Polysaccharide deacetylase family protein n=1 Tax=Sphingobacterium oryzagri TaxID=3025669 RepID=A0ABY7WIW2_9SPHI|nr:polysaccharide deacetylase family protein [Sphingobacterium sp. KACC 22765]WDF68487.1 polysaccharide deacetylase family protein [Sphingobacterium sp. KACC 22765]